MKKNISINISGIIFHIEEDGYDKLKKYLESINRYFSSFEDSSEIISDIENRIAEIFLSKLGSQKQVITDTDIDELIATMGSIKDFQSVEEDLMDEETEEDGQQEKEGEEPRKLHRDLNRKILGGVSSGIAAYFSIDPLWIRLILIILFLSGGYTDGSLSLITLVTYAVFWIVLPGTTEIKEDTKVKKLFRNPDQRVLGGVSSGIAAYFGTDVTVIRLIFILTSFLYGTGLIAYIILWIITPEAKTITDKVEMQGNPVTLSNIESSLKKGLNMKDQESTASRILLFPFRIISIVVDWLGRHLGPFLNFLTELIRILAGVAIIIGGVFGVLGLLIALFTSLGWIPVYDWFVGDITNQVPLQIIPEYLMVMTFLVAVIPILFLTLLGVTVLSKRKVISGQLGWPLFGLWAISIVVLSIGVPNEVNKFRKDSRDYRTLNFDTDKTWYLDVKDPRTAGENEISRKVKPSISPTDKENLFVEVVVTSRGVDRESAAAFAEKLNYDLEREDSVLRFPYKVFVDGEDFRFQEIEVSIHIPEGEKFTVTDWLRMNLDNSTLYRYGLNRLGQNDVLYFSDDQLICETCTEQNVKTSPTSAAPLDYNDEVSLIAFDDLIIRGPFKVTLVQSSFHSLKMNGNESDLDKIEVTNSAGKLEIGIKDKWWTWGQDNLDDVTIVIEVEELEELVVAGGTRITAGSFNADFIQLEFSGAVRGDLKLDAREIDLNLIGASNLTLSGSCRELHAEILGASVLDAFDMIAQEAHINAIAASVAKVSVEDYLEANATGAASVRYRGDPRVKVESSLTGEVRQQGE